MSTVDLVLRRKGCEVATTTPETSVLDAAREMNRRRIGSLVVVMTPAAPVTASTQGKKEARGGTVVGIVTERDILTRVVAAERDPRRTKVREVMTSPVTFCEPETALPELRQAMTSQRIRHVPVWCQERGLCGLISIGDLNAVEAESMVQTIHALEEYIVRG